MEYLTGKDYDHLCSICRTVIDMIAGDINSMDDKYTADEEGPCDFVYDHGLFCGGHTCKESK